MSSTVRLGAFILGLVAFVFFASCAPGEGETTQMGMGNTGAAMGGGGTGGTGLGGFETCEPEVRLNGVTIADRPVQAQLGDSVDMLAGASCSVDALVYEWLEGGATVAQRNAYAFEAHFTRILTLQTYDNGAQPNTGGTIKVEVPLSPIGSAVGRLESSGPKPLPGNFVEVSRSESITLKLLADSQDAFGTTYPDAVAYDWIIRTVAPDNFLLVSRSLRDVDEFELVGSSLQEGSYELYAVARGDGLSILSVSVFLGVEIVP